ncbi:MAG: amino acid racemase [Oscillospiraceae bacterium]|nr:amino acid racemase [Oscillospiraceae bacterium]
MMNRAVGVIGGLGPSATAYFYELVLSKTAAKRDQDHVNMVIMNHASIPDRTAFISGESDESPLPYLLDDAKTLEGLGVGLIVIPCNTAHYFFDDIEKSVSVPMLNIVEEAVTEAERRAPGLTKVGVLATDGTLLAKIYEKVCAGAGIACEVPGADMQKQVMELIYGGVKAGHKPDGAAFRGMIDHLRSKGCQCVILGCTELSVAKRACSVMDSDVVDSLEVLAARTVEEIRSPELIRFEKKQCKSQALILNSQLY